MKFLHYGKDGGSESTVWGFWLVEIKSLFSIALLCFENGSREAWHNHAFNSISWLLSGKLEENIMFLPPNDKKFRHESFIEHYWPSLKPIFTHRHRLHKVSSIGRSWVLTFRGPWSKNWNEVIPQENKLITLAEGRQIVEQRTFK